MDRDKTIKITGMYQDVEKIIDRAEREMDVYRQRISDMEENFEKLLLEKDAEIVYLKESLAQWQADHLSVVNQFEAKDKEIQQLKEERVKIAEDAWDAAGTNIVLNSIGMPQHFVKGWKEAKSSYLQQFKEGNTITNNKLTPP